MFHFYPVEIKTANKILLNIMGVPLLGPLIIVFYALLPFVLVDAYANLTGSSSKIAYIIGGLLSVAWAYHLEQNGTIIKIVLIPAWVWGFILVVGVLFE